MVYIEGLQVSSMSTSAKGTVEKHGRRNVALNCALLDQPWFEFRQQLGGKCNGEVFWLQF